MKALRLALARAAAEVFDLSLAVIDAKQSRVSQDLVAGLFESDRLLVLLDGPDRQAGAVSLDSVLVTALIQRQTIGSVASAAAPTRPFTDTDAALIEPLIDALLSKAVELTGDMTDRACLTNYRFGARVEDGRSAALAMEAEHLRVFTLTVDICGGLQQGGMDLILPDRHAEIHPSDSAKSAGPNFSPSLSDAVMSSPAELTAVLCRLRLPLAELAAMRPGEVLPLNINRFDRTDLLAIGGYRVAVGRLGQSGGFRAVRVKENAHGKSNSNHAPDEQAAVRDVDMFATANGGRTQPAESQTEPRSQLPAISKGAQTEFEESGADDETDDLIAV